MVEVIRDETKIWVFVNGVKTAVMYVNELLKKGSEQGFGGVVDLHITNHEEDEQDLLRIKSEQYPPKQLTIEDETSSLYGQSMKLWGVPSQFTMLIQECAELIKSSTKILMYSNMQEVSDEHYDKFFKEIADVKIMIEQMEFIYSPSVPIIDQERKTKLLRLKQRIEDWKKHL